MIDVGVNLASSQFRHDLAGVLQRARDAGVARMVATGTSLEASQQVLELARRHGPSIRATSGVHPHRASTWSALAEQTIHGLLLQPEVVATGECGLDYERMLSPRAQQLNAFEAQLALSSASGKPLFLHCRGAFEDFVALLGAHEGPRGVVHCFTGSWAQARRVLDLGFDLGVTGWVCDLKRGGDLRDAVRRVPLPRLHLETDAPYLMPATAPAVRPGAARSARNEPANLVWVAREVSVLRGDMTAEGVASACEANSRRLFGLTD